MAFTKEYLPYARQKYFTYSATGGSAADTDSCMIEAFAPSFAFEVDKIHLHLSTVHASIVDYLVYVSHRTDSHYNHDLISQAMVGVKDVLYQAAPYMIFHSGDCVHFSMPLSAANHYGLEITGWAITQPVGGW